MARNKRTEQSTDVVGDQPVSPVWQQPNQAKFINVHLNDEDKKLLQDWLQERHEIIDELFTDAAKHAARISVVPDPKSGRYNATYTPYLVGAPHYGYILSCRAATPTLALYALGYAHLHKVGAWQTASDSSQDLFG